MDNKRYTARFSIILPVRNGGNYAKECVQSILSQTVSDFTLHILDNQSTDDTLEWIRSLDDPRIEIYPSHRSLTIEENWARIKDIPKNEFITLIGHDDKLYPFYLEEMSNLIKKHPNASLYQAHYQYIDSRGDSLRPSLPMDEVQFSHEFLACHMKRTMDSTGTGYLMRSRDYDMLGGIPLYPNLIFADYELWIRLSSISYKATTVRECFAYRIHESVSKTTRGEEYIRAFERYTDFLLTLKEKDGFKEVIGRYGKDFLLYYCQSLSHRLLRMPRNTRTLSVKQFIDRCSDYAGKLIPGQPFTPLSKPLTKIALQLDYNFFGRQVFALYQKIKRR
jgi:glycosyltransferase involved in cell wall biosynthesis